MSIYLETPRLILREFEDSDLEGLFELESNPIVLKYLPIDPVKSKDEIPAIIERVKAQYIKNGIGRFAMVLKESGEFMGWTGLKLEESETNGIRNYYDLGYRVIPKYWGKGYTSESAIASVKWGFEEFGMKVINGAAHHKNIASNIVLQKAALKFVESFQYKDIPHNWYEIKYNALD